jgi:integrase
MLDDDEAICDAVADGGALHSDDGCGMLGDALESERLGGKQDPMQLLEGERVHGPYAHGKRFRLVIKSGDGKQRKLTFDSEDEANEFKAELSKDCDPRTIDEAVSAYLKHLRETGVKETSSKTHWYRLRAFFALGTIERNSGGPLSRLTPERAKAFYDELRTKSAVDTHRNCLTLAKAFGAWCVKQGWLRTNPLADIEPMGRRKRGKEQFRVSEARKFITTCRALADNGDAGAIAAMTALLLGMRASEVVERVVRDLDDDGRLLWIPNAKTDAGRRTLEVPELLRPHLVKLAKGKQPQDRLFTDSDRHYLLYHVRRICDLAKLPPVTAHSLRGLHSTLATEHGSTGHVVASALGHTSYATTRAHYVKPGTVERVARKRVQKLIEPTRPHGNPPPEQPHA